MSSQLSPELLAATTQGDIDLVKSLFPASSPLASIDNIAIEATKAGRVNILSWCFSEGFIPPQKSMNGDFYHAACEGSSPDIWRELFKHGYDLNAHWSEFYGDALCLAAWKGNVELARTLLELGQDPNSDHYFSDETAIIMAITGDDASMEIVELLVKYGLKLEGTGAAMAAAESGNLEALKYLLDQGASIEEREIWWQITDKESIDSKGTALYRACRAGTQGTVEYLLANGADPESKDEVGRSCLAVAKTGGHDELVKILESRGVKE